MHKTLPKREGVTFAAGDLLGGGAPVIISFYYLIFLTDVVGLRPSLAGLVVLISRIWDAISDPLMGVITDNTRSRMGRRKPYFLAGSIGIVIAYVLLWNPIATANMGWRFAYVLFSYLFYSTIQTMVMVPYSAMSAEISMDYTERNWVNGLRLMFSTAATAVSALVPLEIVRLFSSVRTGYLVMALIFGVFFAIPFLLIALTAKERVPAPDERSQFDLSLFIAPLKIRSFRLLVGIYVSCYLAIDVVSAVFAYYMNYYLVRPGELNYVIGALLVVPVFLVPLVVHLANRVGKAKTISLFVLIWAAGLIVLSFLTPAWPAWAIYAVAFVIGCGVIGGIVIPWLMYPDTTDVGELELGKRVSGSFSGIMTLMRKTAGAIGIFVVSTVLEFAGYVPPVTEMIEGVSREQMFAQPEGVLVALRIVVAVVPLVLIVVILILARRYPISKEISERLTTLLERLRGTGSPVDEETRQEMEELRRELV